MACPKCGSSDTWEDNFWSGCNKCGWMSNCERAFNNIGWQRDNSYTPSTREEDENDN